MEVIEKVTLTEEAKKLRYQKAKEWKQKNRDKDNAYQRAWRAKNKEKSRAYQKAWREKNKEKLKNKRIEYWNRKAQAMASKGA